MPRHRVTVEGGEWFGSPVTLKVRASTRREAVETAIRLLADNLRADLVAGHKARSRILHAHIGWTVDSEGKRVKANQWSASVRYDYDSPNGIAVSLASREELCNPLLTPLYRYTSADITDKDCRKIKHGRRCRYMPR